MIRSEFYLWVKRKLFVFAMFQIFPTCMIYWDATNEKFGQSNTSFLFNNTSQDITTARYPRLRVSYSLCFFFFQIFFSLFSRAFYRFFYCLLILAIFWAYLGIFSSGRNFYFFVVLLLSVFLISGFLIV